MLTRSALADLAEIWTFVASDNPEAADGLEAEIFRACEKLSRAPLMGFIRPGWTKLPVRFWLVRRTYWIVYDPAGSPVPILRILHGKRDLPSILHEG